MSNQETALRKRIKIHKTKLARARHLTNIKATISEQKERKSAAQKSITTKKQEDKKKRAFKIKRERFLKKIDRVLTKKITSRRVLKKSKSTVVIHQRETPSILGDPNRFFKEEWNETKKGMFLK